MKRAWGRLLSGEGVRVQMPLVDGFSRNMISLNLKVFLTHAEISKFERKSATILEKDKALGSLKKYERIYP